MGNSTAESRTKLHIEEWKQKLIDLTRRNRLLYFKRTKSSTLVISQPDTQAVFDRLVMKEAEWEFWLPPAEEKDIDEDSPPGSSLLSEKELEPQLQSPLEEEITVQEPQIEVDDLALEEPSTSIRPPKGNELVIEDLSREELEKILINLYIHSISNYEERGVRILYLALGMLEWKETGTSEVIRSPIILAPVELSRESA